VSGVLAHAHASPAGLLQGRVAHGARVLARPVVQVHEARRQQAVEQPQVAVVARLEAVPRDQRVQLGLVVLVVERVRRDLAGGEGGPVGLERADTRLARPPLTSWAARRGTAPPPRDTCRRRSAAPSSARRCS